MFRGGALDATGATIHEIIIGGTDLTTKIEPVVAEKHALSVHAGELPEIRLLTAIYAGVTAACRIRVRTT